MQVYRSRNQFQIVLSFTRAFWKIGLFVILFKNHGELIMGSIVLATSAVRRIVWNISRLLSHFTLRVVIPSFFIHLMLCLFSCFPPLFLFFSSSCDPLLLWLLLFRRKTLPHRGNFAGICEQTCYDFSFLCIWLIVSPWPGRYKCYVSTWLHHWLFVTVCSSVDTRVARG